MTAKKRAAAMLNELWNDRMRNDVSIAEQHMADARRDALEAAARVADESYSFDPAAATVAAKIRALKDTP